MHPKVHEYSSYLEDGWTSKRVNYSPVSQMPYIEKPTSDHIVAKHDSDTLSISKLCQVDILWNEGVQTVSGHFCTVL